MNQGTNEIWKSIPEFEGLYEISNMGNVRSLPRVVKGICDTCTMHLKGGVLSKSYYTDGYVKINLNKDSTTHYWRVHRLVAIAFIPNPENKKEVNHINGIKDDNRVENLEWVTAKENTLHLYKYELKKPRKGIDNTASKCISQYTVDGLFVQQWGSIGEAVRAGFEYSCIRGCCKGKYQTHKGYKWQYC